MARRLLVAGGTVLLLHALAAGSLQLLQLPYTQVVVPGVVVDGRPVGGSTADELRGAVDAHATTLLEEEVVVATSCGEPAVAERREVGIEAGVRQATEEAWSIGRRGLWRGLADQIRVRAGGAFPVALERRLDTGRLERWATATADEVSCAPRRAAVSMVAAGPPEGARVHVTPATPGRDVPAGLLVDAVEAGHDTRGVLRIDTASAAIDPPTSAADVDAAVDAAELAMSAPVRLTNPAGGRDVELDPVDLAAVLAVGFDADAPDGQRLPLTADAGELRQRLDGELDAIEVSPVDARPRVVDGALVIEDDQAGFALDADAAAERIRALATRPSRRTGTLPGTRLDAELTRQDVEGLGIEQQVSSFSTRLVPGEPRNLNIQQAADYLDGSLVLPGEQLSLNEAVGKRTAERGFQENGFIRRGVVVSVYGGGVSQLATTFMNAAWFAGVDLVRFKPHSLYFSRYPVGREATLSWGSIDVVIANDSPHAILVATSHSDTQVTVSFWSTPWAEVETWTGERTNPTRGALRDGFDVRFGRTITYPDGSSTEETYVHRYLPEDDPTDTAAPD